MARLSAKQGALQHAEGAQHLARSVSRHAPPAEPAAEDPNATESPYLSVDPSPAAPAATPTPQLRGQLLDEQEKIFER